MAETLLLPVVRGMLGKAADALVQKVTAIGVDDDRRDLELKLLYVQSLLADAEAKAAAENEAGRAIKGWMRELKAAAYQADDVLDDFQYEALRREAQSLRSTTSKVKDFFSSRNRLVFRHKASRDLKNVLGKIDKLVKDMQKFGLLQREPEAPQALNRDDDKDAVVKLLLGQQDQRSVQVLPIIGMGGLGKTTLAKMVYNDCRVQKHFELMMWHCVSDNFAAIAIVRSVIELATNGRCDLPDNIELLQKKSCRKSLVGKALLCSSIGGSGSMIVLTSRSRQVASIMGTLPPYELACLSEDDSWELFSKKAFNKGMEEQEDFITVGKLIVNKCKGLPLALKTIGGLMRSKYQIKEWEAVSESNMGGNNEVLSILKLSYMHLSSEMKHCFAFCAVFPKDYEMDKDRLIQLWMANNFIQAEGEIDLVQKGEFVFNELVWRSFIQDVNVKKIGSKMHDLMHDLAKYITDECAFAKELIQQTVSVNNIRHMQLPWDKSDEITGLMKSSLSLRTLLAQDSEDMDLKELINITHLRYLDLSESEIVRLPNSICMLYNLQSLRLNSCWNLRFLPEGMKNMRQLTHIYLLGCTSLERMPPKLSLLHNLCTLTLFIVDIGDGFGIEELKDLRQLGNTLELFNLRKVKSGSKVNLHEKKNLTELLLYWGRNVFYNPLHDEIVNNNQEEVLESLVPHTKLRSLALHGYAGLAISQWMRDPQMFCCLRELQISNCPRCKDLPLVWLSSPLETLHLSSMNCLTTLCKNIDAEAAGYSTSQKIFPKLKMMSLNELLEFERWAENSMGEPNSLVMFPQLELLYIANCNKVATLPEAPALTSASCREESAERIVPMSMEWGSFPSLNHLDFGMLVNVVMPVKEHQNQSQRPLNTLRSLNLEGDNGLISIFNSSKLQLGLGDCLAFVEQLKIYSCDNIVSWPVEEFRCLVRLQSLGIYSLEIQFCGSLLEIPKLPASLGALVTLGCQSLVALPSNLGDLAKLRHLRLVDCSELKALPDGMDGLTSLEQLIIDSCPGINRFPQGLLQRLPALKSLTIDGCPDLQRRCREGGEYFDLVSLIPDKSIYCAPKRSMKSRLLSWCVGGS
ncbi:hypothetical protein PVAP13_6KG383700 [Panicum virgatum]|uniref:Uncharacterized protein n=1 Tax=Panicum virgatum TaxID=38727 RepID=A0A8T0RL58_PANVG|nr:hypothetical protein PVAP13_6KG383700 [Panicum virgatum]